MTRFGAGACVLGLAMSALVPAGGGRAATPVTTQAPAAQSSVKPERTVWYFYKVKWGHQDEFLDLFKRNHLPVLSAQREAGRMTAMRTFVPTYHGDGRADWTFAVAITFRDTAAMMGPSGEEAIVKRLYPDQATFKKEEQRRFEIVEAHWDVPLNEVDLQGR
jgi:hypothetical protein